MSSFLVRQEDDQVASARIKAVAIVSVIVVIVSLWIARALLPPAARTRTGRLAGVHEQAEIGMVEQLPFETLDRGREWRVQQREILDHYGWVNAEKTVAHIPIDDAIDLYLRRVKR